jgi:plasmid replication initiation protein
MVEQYHATGVRLLALRQKLRAREGKPEYRKNCEDLRKQIAALEHKPVPTDEEISEAYEAAKSGERSDPVTSGNLTTIPSEAE